MKIKDIMREPKIVSGSSPVVKVRHMIPQEHITDVFIMEGDALVGMITMDELMDITSTRSNIECKGLCARILVSATPEDTSLEMAKQMVDASVRFAPVLDGKKLVGVVDVPCLLSGFLRKGYKPVRKTVSEVMNEPITVDYQTELEKVWWKLKDFTGLPVMRKKSLVGIVTRADLMAHGMARVGRESERHAKTTAPVERVMTTEPVTVDPSTSVEDAARIAVEKGFSMIPVMQGDKLVGVVSQFDLLGAYVR